MMEFSNNAFVYGLLTSDGNQEQNIEIMGARESLARLINKKQDEISRLEADLAAAKAYLAGLQDALKAVPKTSNEDGSSPEDRSYKVRPGTALAKARDALLLAQKPLYVDDLLKAMGKEDTPKERVSLAGTLSSYVRSGRLFTKTGPNTFGLIEFEDAPRNSEHFEDRGEHSDE